MMGRFPFPDLTPLFYLAVVGLVAIALVVIGGGGWLLYHLYRALALYLGV